MIHFDNVSKRYAGGHEALRGLSFEVAAGEMVFVTGHSGAGKTTLLKLLGLIERQMGNAADAGRCFAEAIRIEPANVIAAAQLAEIQTGGPVHQAVAGVPEQE